MTWDDKAFGVAAEQYLWWKQNKFTIPQMVESIPSIRKPHSMTGDGVICWLAQIWDGRMESDP